MQKIGLSLKRLTEMQNKIPGLDKRPFSFREIKVFAQRSRIVLEPDSSIKFGLSYIDRGRPIVLYNPHRSKLKKRHVVGHEIAHIMMEHHKEARCLRFASTGSVLESEADYVAASLVVPTNLFYFYFLNFRKNLPLDTLKRFILSSTPGTTAEEAHLFAKRRRKQIRNTFSILKKDCPYELVCKKGEICPWASKYFL